MTTTGLDVSMREIVGRLKFNSRFRGLERSKFLERWMCFYVLDILCVVLEARMIVEGIFGNSI